MAIPSTLVDRVKIFTTSSGTGPFTLGDAVPAFRGVEALTNGLIYSYAAENGSDFEVGQGQFVSDTNQLIRTVFESSLGAGAPVPFPTNIAVNFTALAIDWESRADSTAALAAATATAAAASAVESESNAALAATAAATSAEDASLAAIAAQAAGHYADDIADGLATYPSGEYFFVPDGSGNLLLYQNDAGVAVAKDYSLPGAPNAGSPSYFNPGGEGPRTETINAYTNFVPATGTFLNCFDGDTTADAAHAMRIASSAVAVAGRTMTASMNADIRNDATQLNLKWSNTATQGTWLIRVTQDDDLDPNAVWEVVNPGVVLGGTLDQFIDLEPSQLPFRAMQFVGLSGSTAALNNPMLTEIRIKLAPGQGSGLPPVGYSGPNLPVPGQVWEYLFHDGGDDWVPDWVGPRPLRKVNTNTNPNWQRTGAGRCFKNGLANPPRAATAQTFIALYKLKKGVTSGRLLSGDIEPVIFSSNIVRSGSTNWYCVDGISLPPVSGTSGAYWMNSGGWVLHICEAATPLTDIWGHGGEGGFSSTTNRSEEVEFAYSTAYPGVLTSDQRTAICETLWAWAQHEKQISLHFKYAPRREALIGMIGASNLEGEGRIVTVGGDAGMSARSFQLAQYMTDAKIAVCEQSNQRNTAWQSFIFGWNQKYQELSVPGVSGADERFGTETGFLISWAQALRKETTLTGTARVNKIPEKMRVFKCGRGSSGFSNSSLGVLTGSTFNADELVTTGLLWQCFIRGYWEIQQAALLEGIGLDMRVFYINGGGADALTADRAATQQADLTGIINTVKAMTGQNPKVVIAIVGDNDAFSTEVRAAQNAVVTAFGGRAISIDPTGDPATTITYNTDGLHIDGSDTGQIRLGQRLWLSSEWTGVAP